MKVILIAVMSIDGKIAETPGQSSLDWTTKEDMRFFVEQTKAAGVMIMGRKTFETIGKALPGRLTVVMTRDSKISPLAKGGLRGVEFQATAHFTNESPKQILETLESNGFDSVVITGGSSVYSAFIREGLVTDYYLTIQPVLFGEGVPLASGFDRVNLTLVETSKLGEQAVLVHYQTT